MCLHPSLAPYFGGWELFNKLFVDAHASLARLLAPICVLRLLIEERKVFMRWRPTNAYNSPQLIVLVLASEQGPSP